MRIDSFTWDRENKLHIARHEVAPREVEEVFLEDESPYILRGRDDRYLAHGQTGTGRYLTVIFEFVTEIQVRPVTAWEMTKKERRRYLKR